MMDEGQADLQRQRVAAMTRSRLVGGLVILFVVGVLVAGTAVSYHFSVSAERQSGLAINAYDLHGDLRQIAGDFAMAPSQQTSAVQADTASAIAGGRQSIKELRRAGNLPPHMQLAVKEANTYLEAAERQLRGGSAADTTETGIASADAISDVVDRAAGEAELASDRASEDSRNGEIGLLVGAVVIVGVGLLWWSRRRRAAAVVATQADERAQFEAMIEQSTDLFFLTGDDNETTYCSPSAARFFGMSAEEVCAAPLDRFVHPDDVVRAADAFGTARLAGTVGPFDVRVRHGDGAWRTLEMAGDDLSRATPMQAVAWHTRDVTDRRLLEEQLERQAFEDSLTGLANRALFRDRLAHAISRMRRSQHSVAVLMLDLDGFKAINDTMGHDAGDAALREVAARIARSARPGDTVARLGGDEFTILLDELDDESFADEVADRILEMIRQPIELDDMTVRVSASIGVAFPVLGDTTPEALLRDADTAMYVAKAAGRDRWVRFEPAMHARAKQQLRLTQDLGCALERRELVVYYQPSVDLATEAIEGVEALLRWKHPELGFVPPERFIPLAEQNGLIVPIGRFVLDQACNQAVNWQKSYPNESGITVAVNVSGYQLNHESLIPDVRHIVANSGIAPERLVLEVTESVLMADIDLVIARLRQLKDLGISIAIDDFGTGYSSLAYLRRLPIDILKIDKSFVDAAAAGDPGGDAIMHAIVDLSHGLNLKTIAEGVEERSQARHVRLLGCDSAQGHLFARALPPEELEILMASGGWGLTAGALNGMHLV
jgi:diguanylate cyclase (GGDEF)-like protein/PAS domain S-box-containing protein